MARKVVLAGACRTAIGVMGGTLSKTPAPDLGTVVIKEALKRTGIKPEQVDEVYMGCVIQAGLGQNPARQAAVNAGIPVEVPATTINVLCGSGMHCVNLAAKLIASGDADIIVAGGMENMSMAPYLLYNARFGYRMGAGKMDDALIRDAFACLLTPGSDIIRVIGNPVQKAGLLIEVTMDEAPLRAGMLDYGLRILLLSALISAVTAILLFLAVQRLIVQPIRRVSRHMASYAEAPEDVRRVIAPTAQVEELREAEEAMQKMQQQLTGSLRQKERLAQLGGAVAKISHDLRNILTTSQLFADRLEGSADPTVVRAAPKLVASISRAVALCESTLKFGKAEEAAPDLREVALAELAAEVAEAEGLAEDTAVACLIEIPEALRIRADSEQLFRVLSNLVRNARQAIEAAGEGGTIEISGEDRPDEWRIRVGDSGPGLPEKAREHLFEAFQGGTRKGGTGLGLAIAAELVRGHGGRLELARSDAEGTEFLIRLPKAGLPT